MRKLDNKYNVALYIRISREDGDKEVSNSITNQQILLKNYIDSQDDLSFYDCYIDDGFTGTNFERPAFQRMIQDIEDGLVNCVIVKDLSRFGRDYIGVGKYVEKYFVVKEIRFIALNDNVDTCRSEYDILMPIKNIFNQQYALDISKKVQTSFKAKQRDGQFIGAFPSYGYKRSLTDKHKLVIDDYAADVVKRIFNMYATGIGQLRIANILNNEGVLCPSEYKRQCGLNYRNSNKLDSTNYWTYSTINKILKNQMYKGDMVQGKTKRRMKGKARYLPKQNWVIVEDTHPAIIDNDLWNLVQKTFKRDIRSINFDYNISIFAGFLKCGDCGRALSKSISGNQVYYVCATYKNYGKSSCTSHRIHQATLDNIILDDLNTIIASIKDLKRIADDQNKLQLIDKHSIEKLIEDYDASIKKLLDNKKESYRDYRDGLISKDEYLEYKKDCNKKIELYNKMKELQIKNVDDNELKTYSPRLEKLIQTNKIDKLDRNILNEMIDMIYIYDDKTIKIVYNFSDELEALLKNEEQ